MSALLLELARNFLFLSFPTLTFKLRMIPSMVVLAPHREVSKALPVVRLTSHKLILSVDDVFGLELLSTTLANKHMATV